MRLLPKRISDGLREFRSKELNGVEGTELRLKVVGSDGETKWLRIEDDELLAILAVLEPRDLKRVTEFEPEWRPELPSM